MPSDEQQTNIDSRGLCRRGPLPNTAPHACLSREHHAPGHNGSFLHPLKKEVVKVYHCNNELNSSTEYQISPEEQFQVFMEIEKRGLDLLGFYHSHPHTSAQPSSLDKERANYYGYSYVIIALHPVFVSSWVLEKEGRFTEEDLQLID